MINAGDGAEGCTSIPFTCPECHERFAVQSCVVNDPGEEPPAPTWYCPPCGTAIVVAAARTGDYTAAKLMAYAPADLHLRSCPQFLP